MYTYSIGPYVLLTIVTNRDSSLFLRSVVPISFLKIGYVKKHGKLNTLIQWIIYKKFLINHL